jgi:DNA-binding transcriptional LysR family regulator
LPTLRQLELFLEASKDCNFRETADRLGISQAGLSQQIRALEIKLGCTVFDRHRGATPALSIRGRRLLPTAREMVAAGSKLTSPRDGPDPKRIIVAIRHYVLERDVRGKVPQFLDLHPGLVLQFIVSDDISTLLQHVRNGNADLGVFRGDPPFDAGLKIEVQHETSCRMFAAPTIAAQIGESLAEINRAPFLGLPQSTGNWIFDRLSEVGIEPTNVVARSQFPNVLAQWAIEGRGVAVLFEQHISQATAEGLLVPLGPRLRSAYSLVVSHSSTPGLSPVVNFLRQAVCSGEGPTISR